MCIKNIILLRKKIENEIKNVNNLSELNIIKSKYIGKNGLLTLKIKNIKNIICIKKKIKFGKVLNLLKNNFLNKIENKKKIIEKKIIINKINSEKIDFTLPGINNYLGNLHPISKIIILIEKYFSSIGFNIVNGNEIENKYYNFDILNIPINHPSRSYNDTFWINKNLLLRTHISASQIKYIKKKKCSLPIKIISSGKVYRKDNYDYIHAPMFHQIDVFYIKKNINFTNLKYIIKKFLLFFFKKKNIEFRFRSSYFPFTYMSGEVDILNKSNKWIEVIGYGMLHPNILMNIDINSNIYSGAAFGMGIERLINLLYDLNNLKLLFDNDLNYLNKF